MSLAAFATCCVAAAAHSVVHWDYTIDDAYITHRHAKNLVMGAGLTFNPGVPVKGYSNTFMTLLSACGQALGIDPDWWSKVLGLCGFFLGLWGVFRAVAAIGAGPIFATWTMLLAAGAATVTFWSVSGLETGLYAGLLMAAIGEFAFLQVKLVNSAGSVHRWYTMGPVSLLLALVVLSRPEGVLLYGACAAYGILWAVTAKTYRHIDLLWWLLPGLVCVAELGFSWAYYGQPFPQTYYAKVRQPQSLINFASLWKAIRANVAGGGYFARGVTAIFGSAWWCLLGLLVLLNRRAAMLSLGLWAVVAAQLIFIARTGGDWMTGYRFCVPIVAPVLLAVSLGPWALHRRLARSRSSYFALSGALLCALPMSLAYATHNTAYSKKLSHAKTVNAHPNLRLGERFASWLPPGSTFSSFDTGGQGFAAPLAVYDAAGLTEPTALRCRRAKGDLRKQCKAVFALEGPDLLRLHKHKGLGFRKLVPKKDFLWSDSKRFIVRRSLIDGEHVPPWAKTADERFAMTDGGVFRLVGDTLPLVAAAGQAMHVELFWRRDGTSAPLARELSLHDARGHRVASLPPTFLTMFAEAGPSSRPVLRDHLRLEVPDEPGRYVMSAVLGTGSAKEVATIQVVEAGSAPSEDLWPHDRLADWQRARLEHFARDSAASERRYHAVAARQALEWARSRNVLGLRRAYALLRRAFWETGTSGEALDDAFAVLFEIRAAYFRKRVPAFAL